MNRPVAPAPRGVRLRTGEIRIVEPQHSVVPGWHVLAVMGTGALAYLAIFALIAAATTVAVAFAAVFITGLLVAAGVAVWLETWDRQQRGQS